MALKAINRSDKFSIRISKEENIISIQHILTTKSNQNSFVEFIVNLKLIIDYF